MTRKKIPTLAHVCIDCSRDISSLHHNAKRCVACSRKRKQLQDSTRHLQDRTSQLQWHNFIENPENEEVMHRSAKGTKLRYWLDKLCKVLTIEDLEFLLTVWDWRTKDPLHNATIRREYRTCAGIVRDWRDYFVVTKWFNDTTFDAETGIIFNADGSYLTVDLDENQENYIIRNSEGTEICRY